jgi:hypothetical protein
MIVPACGGRSYETSTCSDRLAPGRGKGKQGLSLYGAKPPSTKPALTAMLTHIIAINRAGGGRMPRA